jgi:hypothetical protein
VLIVSPTRACRFKGLGVGRQKTDDRTLEGKDENKVGRVQRKIGRAEKTIEK